LDNENEVVSDVTRNCISFSTY